MANKVGKYLMKKAPLIIMCLTIFLLTGCPAYLMNWRVHDTDLTAFRLTPIALLLMFMGSFGLLISRTNFKMLTLGCSMIFCAFIWLNYLLTTSYPR